MGPTAQGGEEEVPSKVKSQTYQGGSTDHWLPPSCEQRPPGSQETVLQIVRYFLPKNQGKVSNIDSQRPRTERPNSTSNGIRPLREVVAGGRVLTPSVVPTSSASSAGVPRNTITFLPFQPDPVALGRGKGRAGKGHVRSQPQMGKEWCGWSSIFQSPAGGEGEEERSRRDGRKLGQPWHPGAVLETSNKQMRV